MISQNIVVNLFGRIKAINFYIVPGHQFARQQHNDQFFKEQKKIQSDSLKRSQQLANSDIKDQTPQHNYNQQQYRNYTKQIEQALKIQQIQEVKLKEANPIDLLPRRQRRQYDRPQYDLNLSQYDSWRVFDRTVLKDDRDSLPVAGQIAVPPRLLRHVKKIQIFQFEFFELTQTKVFGWGFPSYRNSNRSTYQYDFQDTDLSLFLVYDFKSTTQYWGANKENYDYQNQSHISPRNRFNKYPSIDEFWNSDEPHQFRINCSQYADFRKFKKWILLEEQAIEKYGQFQFKDKFDADYQEKPVPSVFQYDQSYWLEKNQKIDPKKAQGNIYYNKIKAAVKLSDEYQV